MRHAVTLTIAALGLVMVFCSRADKPPGAEPTRSAEGAARAGSPPVLALPSSSPSRAANPPLPCLVPTPDQPPPEAAAAQACPADPLPEPPRLPRGQVTFIDAADQPVVEVELAREAEHRARGLMYRTEMAESEGMLFSWMEQSPRSFWMRNTCLPLDMLFVAADGTIVGVLEQVPVLNESARTVPCPAAHVLEVNAGYCRRHGIRAGQRIRIDL